MRHFLVFGLLVLCSLNTACEKEISQGDGCNLIVGDLVVSELMLNPVGSDTGREWIEIYNASSESIILNRVIFRVAGSGEAKDYTVRGAPSVAAKSYFVMGDGNIDELEYLDFSYDDGISAFNNTVGSVQILCKDDVIDQIVYGGESDIEAPDEGKSLAFEGGVAPSYELNDDSTYWCSATETITDDVDGNKGTPGNTNGLCGFATCDDNGTVRDVVPPTSGDLIITEVFGNASGSDTGKEWIEIYMAGSTTVDLNGLSLVITKTTEDDGAQSSEKIWLEGTNCTSASNGAYFVIGASTDTSENGGVSVDVLASDLSMGNSNIEKLTIDLKHGSTIIDTAIVGEPFDGKSTALDPAYLSSSGNDLASNFCEATVTGIFDEIGSPGQANTDLCGGTCNDGGTARAIVAPAAGDFVINEIYANAQATGGANEWIELAIESESAIDLNGLEMSITATSTRVWTLDSNDCIEVSKSTTPYVVIGTDSMSEIPTALNASSTGSLYDSAATI
ncbi:MAG: hypothetical protein QGI45_04900, partial [Myxococcota bacterium]|nr:hypothetical protein [Myxococcota bacterium]